MKNLILFLSSIVFISSCQSLATKKIQEINFSTEYKFSSEIQEELSKDTLAHKFQFSASKYANKGDYKNALLHWDLGMPTQNREYGEEQKDSIRSKYSVVNAKEYIIQEAQKHRVLIINEAHHNSKHRFFTKSLLEDLYEQGYRNFGLEALDIGNNLDSALNSRAYPIQKTGYYTKDPQFGNLLRDALDIGYNIFAYERIGTFFGKQREIGQAKNIKRVMQAKPDEKFLIHCGFDHAMEGEYSGWEKAMAARLKEFTGIDPLTINQEEYSEKSNPKFDHPLLKTLQINEAAILIDKNSNGPFRYERGEAWTDIAVLHPNTQYIDNRPDWLFEDGNENVSIELDEITLDFPVLILAYKKGEDINIAVPVDIFELKDKSEKAHLALKKGAYEIVVTNKKQAVKFEKTVE